MSTKVVGNAVTVFEVTPLDRNGNADTTIVLLGRWESIEVNFENVWSELTASDAEEPEERFIMEKWSATIKGFIDSQGSTALRVARKRYLMVVFTEEESGVPIRLYGGVDKATANYSQMNAKDDLAISSKGKFNGQPSFQYV